jgi:hypothetical protein
MKQVDEDLYDTLRTAIAREVDRTLQEPMVGEKWLWSTTTMGRIVTQFRGFGLAAFGKQTLHNLHHMDSKIAAIWLTQTMAATVAYGARTFLNYAGTEQLDEKLSAGAFVTSALANSSWMPMMAPLAVDTAADVFGFDPLFRHNRTSNMVGGAFLGNPTVDLASKAYGIAKIAAGFTTGDTTVTQRDARSAVRAFLPNALGVQFAINHAVQQFPERDPNETYQPNQ